MKMLKKVLSVLLACVMLLCLFSCGNTNDVTEPTPEPTPTAEPEKTIQEILQDLPNVQWESSKNVILFIADGMGKNHIPATDSITGGRYDGKLVIEYFTTKTSVITTTLDSGSVEPDSASGGTAMACGYRSLRKYIGLDSRAKTVQNLCELCTTLGKLSGVVTSESIVDATPATFTAHVKTRHDEEGIAEQQLLESPATLIMGGGTDIYTKIMNDDPTLAERMGTNNTKWVTSWSDVTNFDGNGRLVATLTGDYWDESATMTPTLAEMTSKSIEVLSKNENGFFLMVEAGALDEAAHTSDIMELSRQMIALDEAVEVAVRYAYEHKDTVVIVTSDHNTGALKDKKTADAYIKVNKNSDNYIGNDTWCTTNTEYHCLLEAEKIAQAKNPDVNYDELAYRFTTIKHVNDDVELYAIGYNTAEMIGAEKNWFSYMTGKMIGKLLSGAEFGSTTKNGK